MANLNETEISLMKGVSTNLDEDTVFTLGYFVHTEKGARDKSEYLYVGRIDKLSDLKKEIASLDTDEKKLLKWTWSALPKYESVVYDGDDTNARAARWLKNKLDKIVTWDMFCKIVDGWKELKSEFNTNAKYASENYTTLDGATTIANLKESKDILLSLVGQSIIHNTKTI